MPEGHVVHRQAIHLRKHFVGQQLLVQSPQGRFAAEAKKLSGLQLISASAVGKHLFLEFEKGLTVRVHLGIYGKWQFQKYKNEIPTVTGEVRLRIISKTNEVADLRGPTACELIDQERVQSVLAKLGPDPLAKKLRKKNADLFIERVSKSKAPIAQLLMDQSVVSGIGNVYRAELLFRAGIDPKQAGNSIDANTLRKIWDDAAYLLEHGVKSGLMITREEVRGLSPEFEERYFVYKREGLPCRICGKRIEMSILAGRKLYWCPKCQQSGRRESNSHHQFGRLRLYH